MKDIIALYAKTESGDEYLRVYVNVIDTTDLIQRMQSEFDEEFAYIGSFELNAELYYGEIDENLIWSAIEQEGE
jgi:hypothetical protein